MSKSHWEAGRDEVGLASTWGEAMASGHFSVKREIDWAELAILGEASPRT